MAFFDFLKDSSGEKKATSKAFGFLSSPTRGATRAIERKRHAIDRQVDSLAESGSPRQKALKAAVATKSQVGENQGVYGRLKLVPGALGEATRDVGTSVARGVARIPETVARSGVQLYLPSVDQSSGPATDPIRRFAYGSEPIKTYQKQGKEVETSTGIPSPLAGLGLAGLDLVGGGKGSMLKQLSKETTEVGVKNILKNQVSAETAQRIAPAIARTKDQNIIKNIIDKATAPPRMVPEPPVNQVTPDIISATVPTPPPSVDPVSKFTSALKGQPAADGQSPVRGVPSLQREQKELYSAERAAKLAKSKATGENLSGRESIYSELGALKGELQKVDATTLQEHLRKTVTPDDVESILDTLKVSPNLTGYEPITARKAVLSLYDEGRVPTSSEYKILEKALGADFTDTVKQASSLYQKSKNIATEVIGAPKSLVSSFDVSAMGRQGLTAAPRFREEFKDSFGAQFKYLSSDKNYQASMQEIAERPTAAIHERMKLALTGVKDNASVEEAYPSSLPQKLPILGGGFKASDRAYTGALTQFRADIADKIIKDLEDTGKNVAGMTDKELRGIGEFINTVTGRGGKPGGWIDRNAEGLGQALFSPRLWASRLQPINPNYWRRLGPTGRKYAMQSYGSFAALAGTVLGLVSMIPGVEVETDARSSDFLKIKHGDTRYDILGGYQQNMVLAHRTISGEKKSSQTGAVTKFARSVKDVVTGKDKEEAGVSENPMVGNRLNILGDFIQNKESPGLATASRIYSDENRAGEPINLKNELIGATTPLAIQAAGSEIMRSGPIGAVKAVPGFIGAGVQSYGVKDLALSKKQKNYTKELENKGESKEKIAANKLFFQTIKTSPSRDNASETIKSALEAGDSKKAIQLSKDYNKAYEDNFKDWESQYGQYKDKTLTKEYKKHKITKETLKRWQQNIKKGDKL